MSRATTKKCAHCGRTFGRDNRCTWAYWARAKYCSSQCAGLAHTATAAANRQDLGESFNRWFVQTDGCWEWNGARDKDGYGIFSYARKSYRAAKIALQLDGRPVPAGMYACHHCDNPACVRPSHLYPGTPKQNMADCVARGRVNAGKKAKLTVDDVIAIRSAAGTHEEIASRFGVSRPTISMVIARKTWGRIP